MSDWIRREAENYKSSQQANKQLAEREQRRAEALAEAWPLFWRTVVGHIEGDVTAWNKALSDDPSVHIHTDRVDDLKLRIRDDNARDLLLLATGKGLTGTTTRKDPNGNARDVTLPLWEWVFDGNRVSGVKTDKGTLAPSAVAETIVRMFLPKPSV